MSDSAPFRRQLLEGEYGAEERVTTGGGETMPLESVDSADDAGWISFPEPFKVKADDGITDLYGVMYFA